MSAEKIGRKSIKAVNGIINNALLLVIIALISFGGYALWDSKQLHQAADKSNYAVYKPTAENEGLSFLELQSINEEVFAWLTVYGTNIDYPVTQGPDNMKYVNTSAEGLYSLSGAIFLDWYNSKDFSDFNNIVYGHHMAKRVMFGEIGEFSDESMFDSHRYGNLYYDEKDHGIEFFAFLHVDAYDSTVFNSGVRESDRRGYLEGLLDKATYARDIGVTVNDRIVLLSTCSSDSTNGRDILVGRITDEVYEDTTGVNVNQGESINIGAVGSIVNKLPLWIILPIIIISILLIIIILDTHLKRKQSKKRTKRNRSRIPVSHRAISDLRNISEPRKEGMKR